MALALLSPGSTGVQRITGLRRIFLYSEGEKASDRILLIC
jgi:hypothetical protein